MIFAFGKTIRTLKHSRLFCTSNYLVLGIETSCDDTAAAVVNSSKVVLGESHFSQFRIHLESGGVMPNVANQLHKNSIKGIVESSMKQSGLDFKDLSAIAVTVKPGLILSLMAGVEYAKDLCTLYRKPMIPIHHMEAHALTGRLIEDVNFPFITFLMSGGHCILAVVKSSDKFYKLGEAQDLSPGTALDKFAKRARLRNLKKFRRLMGGQAVEAAALEGNPTAFNIPFMTQKSCNFSFSGILTKGTRHVTQLETEHKVAPDGVVPQIHDLCASFQWAITRHMSHRLEIAFNFVEAEALLGDEKCLVVSGGVASNKFIRKALKFVCDSRGYRMVVPPSNLCTDNGAMIAWNGIERLRENLPVVQPNELNSVTPLAKFPLGEDISQRVEQMSRGLRFQYVKPTQILAAAQESQLDEREREKL